MNNVFISSAKKFFTDKWVDVKGFGDKERAEELLNLLKD